MADCAHKIVELANDINFDELSKVMSECANRSAFINHTTTPPLVQLLQKLASNIKATGQTSAQIFVDACYIIAVFKSKVMTVTFFYVVARSDLIVY